MHLNFHVRLPVAVCDPWSGSAGHAGSGQLPEVEPKCSLFQGSIVTVCC